jgi:D-3-phosphoglycerate dehydrogenase
MDLGVELQNKTLGIVGFGRIGREVASRMNAFGMTILVDSPNVTDDHANEMGCKKVDLQAHLKESDVITLHSPLTQERKGLIGEGEFEVMKTRPYL